MIASVSSIWIDSKIVIANKWFADDERALAVTLLAVSMAVGQAVSFVLTGVAFADIGSESVGVAAED